jgi:hypothetical protein
MNNYTNICNVLMEQPLCKDISNADKVDCSDPGQNETDYLTPWMLWNCIGAVVSIIKDLFNFIVDSVKWLANMTASDFRSEQFSEANEFNDSIKNYLAVEFEKQKELGYSNSRAGFNLAGVVVSKIKDSIADLIGANYTKLGCYKPQIRRQKMCKMAVELLAPPAMGMGLIFWKGPKMMNWIRRKFGRNEVQRVQKSRTLTPETAKTPEERNFLKLTSVFEKNKGLLNDHEKGTTAFYPGRTIRAFEATPAEDVAKIFDPTKGGFSRDDFEKMYWSMKSGEIKATPQQMSFVDDIRHMVDDHGPFFWKDGLTDQERGFQIIETLRRADAEWNMAKGRDASALATDKALSLTEKGVIDRALGEHLGTKFENQRWYHGVRNYLFPHYNRVSRIVETNNTLRKRLQLAYKADEPFDHSLSKVTKNPEYSFSAPQLTLFREKIGDTAGELNTIRGDIKGVYGEDLTIAKPQIAANISVSGIDRTIRKTNKSGDNDFKDRFDDLYDRSNQDLDQLEGSMQKAYRGNEDFFPTRDINETHLRLRHRRHKDITKKTRGKYQRDIYSKTPKNPDYEVQTKWTVTVRHEKTVTKTRRVKSSDGKWKTETYQDTKRWTSSYGRDRLEDIPARVGEVIDDKVTPRTSDLAALPYARPKGAYAVSASNGAPRIDWVNQEDIDKIMASGSSARAIERPFRQSILSTEKAINNIQDRYQSQILGNPQAKRTALEEMDNLIDSQRKLSADLNEHLKKDSKSVISVWKDDNHTDFKIRNQKLLVRADHMVQRLRYTREQIFRNESSLKIEYRLPDHSRDLARLEEIHNRYRKQQAIGVGTGVTVGAAAGGEVWYAGEDPEYDSKTLQMIGAISEFFEQQDQRIPAAND